MSEVPDKDNLILQELLQGQRDIRQVVSELAANTATKTDLTEIRIDMKSSIDKINWIMNSHETAISMLKMENNANTQFRKSVFSGIKYTVGAIFVSGLGIGASMLPGVLTHSANALAGTTTSIATPAPVHLHFPPKE